MTPNRRPWSLARLREPFARLAEELDTIVERDPSVRSRGEAALHPALPGVLIYRIGNVLYRRGMRQSARAVAIVGRLVSGGVEIHPGASIGRRFFIDHGCGVVIGETAVIGDDVTLFHQVTLGSVGWWKDRRRPAGSRRHPRLGNGVTVGANATLLGPICVGDNTIVGAQSLLMSDVPANTRIHAPRSAIITEGQRPADPASAAEPVEAEIRPLPAPVRLAVHQTAVRGAS